MPNNLSMNLTWAIASPFATLPLSCTPQKCRPTSWLKLQQFITYRRVRLCRFVSSRSSRRGSLQHIFMMESAQYRRAANDVAGGDTMTHIGFGSVLFILHTGTIG